MARKSTKTPGDASKTPAAPKPADAAAPKPKVVASTPVVAAPELRKKELIDQVVVRSGVKKKDAKPAIEALLAILGETVAEGRELNLQPFGKLKINRSEEKANGRVVICRLRQSAAVAEKEKEPLAQPAD
ncbi:HU family DNA-binding protein [Ruegeria sp. 2205SS24-7]|uniref:HU family DNA-binding protein n=1 Tax=Ruegeria discodermiae TaxID=3064389 RepID=UPI002741AB0E|nr:HU family DNA-binding protein [Ruegeria sp. 2205SS24-7]MDP5216539.1 HU family DNA-binding protein [Ruegeria sp. 2205SS24-7]